MWCAIRMQSSYTNGSYVDKVFSRPDNQTKLWFSMNSITEKFWYSDDNDKNMRLIVSAPIKEPVTWRITKCENAQPLGIQKLTLYQDRFNEHTDYVNLETGEMYANYFDSEIAPTDPSTPRIYRFDSVESAKELLNKNSDTYEGQIVAIADNDLGVFQTNQDRDFYIKKTGTSTWEVYGTYGELWGSYCLHRIFGTGADIGVTVNMNSVSALPENCRQAAFGGCANYSNNTGLVNGHSVNSDVPANAKFTDTTYAVGTATTAGLTKLYTTVGTAIDGTMTQAAINAKFYDNGTSRTANTVLSAPNGSAGSATFRKLVIADLPIKELTATQYAALSESEKKNGKIYLVN